MTPCVVVLMTTQLFLIGQSRVSPRSVAESDIYYDTGYHRAVRLPDAAWRAFSQWLKEGGLVENRHLIRADVNQTVIDVSGNGRRDFLVEGATTWLTGADNSWFWVIAHLDRGYRVILFAHTGYLRFQNVKSHGLRDIYTFLPIGGTEYVNRYKFDGRRYKAYKCTETDPTTKKTRRTACSD